MSGELNAILGLLAVIVVLVLIHHRRRVRVSTSAHGTAAWADDDRLEQAGLFDPGLALGRSAASGRLISLGKSNVHTAIFAPPGAGKSVLATTWLLSYRAGSVVALDPKGELFRLTADYRRRLGPVYRIDPFGVCGPGGDAWNPLDLIGDGPDLVDDARPLAEAMVVRPPEGDRDPHWGDQAANCITGVLAFVLSRFAGRERSLGTVRETLTRPGAFEVCADTLRESGEVLARLGGVMAALESKEKAGVLSTAHRHTTFLDSPAILTATAESTCDLRAVLHGHATVYLVLPPHQLEAQNRWLRLVLASVIRLIGKEGVRDGRECLLLLDEAGTVLGSHLPAVEQALTLLRGHGLKVATFWQSAAQVRAVLRDREQVIYDNCDQVYISINSLETAERVSKMLGAYTRAVVNHSATDGYSRQTDRLGDASAGVSGGSSASVSVHARNLLDVSELLCLPADALIAFVRGVGAPVMCERVRWYHEPALVRRQKGG